NSGPAVVCSKSMLRWGIERSEHPPRPEDRMRRSSEAGAGSARGMVPDAEIRRRRGVYEALIREHEALLLGVARRMCAGDEDRAQDLVQDVLVRGYEAFVDGRFEEGTNARAWLMRILTNRFINEHKRRQKWEADIDIDTLEAQEGAQRA